MPTPAPKPGPKVTDAPPPADPTKDDTAHDNGDQGDTEEAFRREQEAIRQNEEDEKTREDERAKTTRVGKGGIVNTELPSDSANSATNIFHRAPDGTEHGPMPLDEWAEYSANHGL
jgi:hypothetical protein